MRESDGVKKCYFLSEEFDDESKDKINVASTSSANKGKNSIIPPFF
jgi:hypothetical protein